MKSASYSCRRANVGDVIPFPRHDVVESGYDFPSLTFPEHEPYGKVQEFFSQTLWFEDPFNSNLEHRGLVCFRPRSLFMWGDIMTEEPILRPGLLRRRIPYRRVLWLAGGTLIILSALTYLVIRQSQPPLPVKYLTAPVRSGSLSQSDSATGEIIPVNTFSVTSPSNATLTHLNVQLGQKVAAGSVLATFSDPALASQVAAQQKAVLNDQNQLSQLTSPTYAAAQQATISQIQDNLSQAQDQLAADQSAEVVSAPLSGTISQIAPAGGSVSQGQTVAVIAGKAISAPFSGTVQHISYSSGQFVSSGSTVLSMSSPAMNAKILGDESQVANYQAQLDKAELQGSSAQLTNAIGQARAQLQRDQQLLSQEQQALSNLVVKAPFSGQVVSLNSSPTATGKLLTLNDSHLMVTVPISETQVNAIHSGQVVHVSLPALSGKALTGSVQSIGPVGTYTNGVSTFPVNVSLNPTPGVRYGMTAQVAIVVKTINHALLVPLAAIHSRGSHNFVEIQDAQGQPTRMRVHVLLENSSTAAVKSPRLHVNDHVITATLTSATGKLHLKTKGRALRKGRPGPKGAKGRKKGL